MNQYDVQAKVGAYQTQGAGCIGQGNIATQAAVRQANVTEGFVNQLESLLALFRDIKDRQGMLIERLNGPRPCNNAKEANAPVAPCGSLGLIDERMRWLSEIGKEMLENQIILDRLG